MSASIPVIIVDDIKAHREILEKKLGSSCPQLKVMALCSNITEAEVALKTCKPVIVFLDIDLGRQNGFDLIKKLEGYSLKIIFVSANLHR